MTRLPPATRRPRIVLVTWVSPFERWGGAAQRTRLLMDALARCGALDVLVLHPQYAPVDTAPVEDRLGAIRIVRLAVRISRLADSPHLDLPSRTLTRAVERVLDLRDYDVVVSRYVKPAAKLRLPPGARLIVDFDDAVFDPPWRALRGPRAWLAALVRTLNDRLVLAARLRHGALGRAHFFFCGGDDRAAFPRLASSLLRNLPVPPDRAGPPAFEPPAAPALLFLGMLDYPPNRDAVDWYIGAVWPQVLREVPAARFLVVGKAPPRAAARWRQAPRVEVLGFVERLDEAYARASACVVPLRSGGGSPIKALEAYLYGRMIVATPRVLDAHRPLLRAGIDALAADDAGGFARACIDVLRDPARASAIARSGYARLAGELSEERFAAVVSEAVHNRLDEDAGASVAPVHSH